VETDLTQVLVVDDFEPFRQFLCSMLLKMPDFHIAGEASDGLEAIQKAAELQPDLIVLDIGLPGMNGIEAARQIRKLSPESRIVFVSQESSADVVQEALRLGAFGYVIKAHAASEMFATVEAVRQGKQFVSARLTDPNSKAAMDAQRWPLRKSGTSIAKTWNGKAACNHEVQFYSDEDHFVAGLAHFVETELEAGNVAIAVLTESHRKNLLQRLRERGVDVCAASEQRRLVFPDADETLSRFMESAGPNRERFLSAVEPLLRTAQAITETSRGRVVVCGEMVSILCSEGRLPAAIQLEQWWNELAQWHTFHLRCTYAMTEELQGEPHALICEQHSAVLPAKI
jgi:CheY-like chemotaxis protein